MRTHLSPLLDYDLVFKASLATNRVVPAQPVGPREKYRGHELWDRSASARHRYLGGLAGLGGAPVHKTCDAEVLE